MKDLQHCNAVSKAINSSFLIALDTALRIKFTNKAFASAIKGIDVSEKNAFLNLFDEATRQSWNKIFDALTNIELEGTSITASVIYENNSIPINWIAEKVVGEDNQITGFEISGHILKDAKGSRALATDNKPIFSEPIGAEDIFKLQWKVRRLLKLLNSSLDIICVIDENGIFVRVSAACKTLLGYDQHEMTGRNYLDFVVIEDIEKTIDTTNNIKKGHDTRNFENRYYKKDGSTIYLNWSSRWEESDRRYYCIARDATENKLNQAALKESEEKYRIIFYNHPLPMFVYDTETFMLLEANKAAIDQYEYSMEELLQMQIRDILANGEVDKFDTLHSEEEYYLKSHRGIWKHRKKNGEVFYAEITSNYIGHLGRKSKLVLAKDRTKDIIAENELIKTNEKYHFFTQATFDAIYDWDLNTGEVQWNDAVKSMFGVTDDGTLENVEWWYGNLHPEDRERVQSKLDSHFANKVANWEDEYRFRKSDNTYKYIYDRAYIVYDGNDKPVRLIGAMQDLTERKGSEDMLRRLNNSLEKRAKELAESNAELERFAYVASHDLQEPLRMVTSFLQLLEKKYKDKLDHKANEYIAFAVDGAERMKRLILDLLEYSRVNSSKVEKEDVDTNEIIDDVRSTYKSLLRETGGTINSNPLPVIKANKTQILQLFQNLVGNAFKYRSEDPPCVNIGCEEETLNYKFFITDNGIGIDPKFFNKIFIIFQRLHHREQYSGTGIGLAICKKIVDKHGGKIWLNSALGQGSTFYFTIPKIK